MHSIKRIVSLLLTLLCILSLAAPTTFAQGNQPQTKKRVVKVAFPEQKYLTEIDENGNYYGYSYEYLKKVAEFANWKLEYITYPNMSLNDQIVSGMNMVASGEADLIGTMLHNEALEEKYLYPSQNYGVVYTTLDALDSNFDVNEANYMHRSPLRIAILKTATNRNAELANFMATTGINYEYVSCDSVDEQVAALEDGRADVLLKVSLTFLPKLKQIAAFAPRPYYFVSSYGNEDLIRELDEAIGKINITDPYYENRLRAKYFQNTTGDFALSEREKAYLRNHGQMQVLVLPQYAPFAFEGKDGELCGMSVSILDNLGKAAGISFHYNVLKKQEDIQGQIYSGKYDIVIGPPNSAAFAQSNNLVLSQAYLESSLTMFVNKSAASKPKSECVLALLRDVSEPIGYKYKEIRYYNSIQESLDAVNKGEADYGYGNRYVVDFYTSQFSHKNLNYLNLEGYNREVGFYVPNTEASELLSILNKYVRSIPIKDVHSYLALALSNRDYGNLKELIQNNPLPAIAVAVVFLFLVLLTVMMAAYNTANKRRNETLQLAYTAKSDFLSRMSHDMRTPMNGIIGLTGLTLDMKQLPWEAVDNLKKIDDSAKYLLSLINDTLDMNKIESNKIVLNEEPTNLHHFFDQMVSIARVSATQKKVTLLTEESKDSLPLVYLDKVRVQQIFFNLLSNAIKFTPENGTVEIKGVCSVWGDGQIHTKLTIKDTGIGIDETFLPKLFEPFEQEYNSATTTYAGTGLGLAIVKNLVDIMGGTISVTSTKGVGSEFVVTLPFDIADVPSEPDENPQRSHGDLVGKRVLLCEDHPLNAQIATKLLEKKGMLVEHAANGQVAVDLFQRSKVGYYDGILMDIRMPVMDGLEATRTLRGLQREDAKTIPIIAMTANAFDEDVQKSMAAGMSAHLAKPIEPQKLYDTLLARIQQKPFH